MIYKSFNGKSFPQTYEGVLKLTEEVYNFEFDSYHELKKQTNKEYDELCNTEEPCKRKEKVEILNKMVKILEKRESYMKIIVDATMKYVDDASIINIQNKIQEEHRFQLMRKQIPTINRGGNK